MRVQVAQCMQVPAAQHMRGPGDQCTQGPAARSMQAQVAPGMQDRGALRMLGQVVLVTRVLAALVMPPMRQINSARQSANPWHRHCR